MEWELYPIKCDMLFNLCPTLIDSSRLGYLKAYDGPLQDTHILDNDMSYCMHNNSSYNIDHHNTNTDNICNSIFASGTLLLAPPRSFSSYTNSVWVHYTNSLWIIGDWWDWLDWLECTCTRRKWGVLQLHRAIGFELHRTFATSDNLEGSSC